MRDGTSCKHRLNGKVDGHCLLETHLRDEEGYRRLVFRSEGGGPVRCDALLFKHCPFKANGAKDEPLDSKGTVRCEWCGGRHDPSSLNRKLCREWHRFKAAHQENQKAMSGARKFYLHGTREAVFSIECDEGLRRQLWPKVKVTILRRDRFTCQDCGRRGRTLVDGKWKGLEVHHIVPRSEGGNDHPANLKTLCVFCHASYTVNSAKERAIMRANESEVEKMNRLSYLYEIGEMGPDDVPSMYDIERSDL